MQDVTHPHHAHEHRVWMVPDSSLGRSAAFVFVTAAVVAVAAPVVAWITQLMMQPGTGTGWFFMLWGTTLVALVVTTGAAAVATAALVRDHAVLLVAPAAVAVLAVVSLLATDGVLN